jgi:hypothetical protein
LQVTKASTGKSFDQWLDKTHPPFMSAARKHEGDGEKGDSGKEEREEKEDEREDEGVDEGGGGDGGEHYGEGAKRDQLRKWEKKRGLSQNQRWALDELKKIGQWGKHGPVISQSHGSQASGASAATTAAAAATGGGSGEEQQSGVAAKSGAAPGKDPAVKKVDVEGLPQGWK